ncbi:MAG: SCP2 sterol-binding domain-containing protein [Planctomycetota bacterium]|nr:SCP2 sterol-binding domain-containing protein [Planctomycetota bacterium]
MVEVVVESPETTNMLCLILRQTIERNLRTQEALAVAEEMDGSLAIGAGKMRAHIFFENGRVRISSASEVKPTARIEGSLAALAQSVSMLGAVKHIFQGRLRVKGSLPFLLKVLKILKPREEKQVK